FGDVHIYRDHMEQVELQLTREPRPLPRLCLNPEITRLEDFRYEDFELLDYDPHPHIAGKVSV
ncbi:MAG: thymidylate synthase, partial [Porphyromonas sp.]